MSKFLDENGLLYLWGKIKTLAGGKVDKVEGKGLSTNDYTNDDKAKLGGIAEGATKVEASETNGNIKVNGSETPVYVLPDTVLHQSDFETVTEAEILALFEETVAE